MSNETARRHRAVRDLLENADREAPPAFGADVFTRLGPASATPDAPIRAEGAVPSAAAPAQDAASAPAREVLARKYRELAEERAGRGLPPPSMSEVYRALGAEPPPEPPRDAEPRRDPPRDATAMPGGSGTEEVVRASERMGTAPVPAVETRAGALSRTPSLRERGARAAAEKRTRRSYDLPEERFVKCGFQLGEAHLRALKQEVVASRRTDSEVVRDRLSMYLEHIGARSREDILGERVRVPAESGDPFERRVLRTYAITPLQSELLRVLKVLNGVERSSVLRQALLWGGGERPRV